MSKANIIHPNDLRFDNTRFWAYFLSVNYPCAVSEESGCSMYDFVAQILPVDAEWTDDFTQYYEGVLQESDGYLEHPTTFLADLSPTEHLKIEFHPGDTIFYINDKEIGCTGPHWDLWKIPYPKIKEVLTQNDGEVLFQLLLPMAALKPDDIAHLKPVLGKHFSEFGFTKPLLTQMIDCLVFGLTKQSPPKEPKKL